MKIGIFGSGNLGQALGHGFVARGDEVLVDTPLRFALKPSSAS